MLSIIHANHDGYDQERIWMQWVYDTIQMEKEKRIPEVRPELVTQHILQCMTQSLLNSVCPLRAHLVLEEHAFSDFPERLSKLSGGLLPRCLAAFFVKALRPVAIQESLEGEPEVETKSRKRKLEVIDIL